MHILFLFLLAIINVRFSESVSKANFSAKLTATQDAFAGAAAGFFARLAVAPIDLVKIRLQLQRNRIGDFVKSMDAVNIPQSSPKYTGMWQTMKTVAREEGFCALWKGNVPAQIMVMSFVAIKFSTYNYVKKMLHCLQMSPTKQKNIKKSETSGKGSRSSVRNLCINMIAGGIAGAVATAGTYPLDLLRTRLAGQTEVRMEAALTEEVMLLWTGGGLRAFYAGIQPALVSIVPYMALQLSFYEIGKAAYDGLIGRRADGGDEKGMWADAWAGTAIGGLAGGLSKLATMPLDLCKKRMQAFPAEQLRLAGSAVGGGWWATLRGVIQQEGLPALWKGSVPAVLKTVPATAVTFGVYEVAKAAMLRRDGN